MADKYISLDDTTKSKKEKEATVVSAGAGNSGEIVALGADGKLDDTVLPDGIGAEVVVAPASEALTENEVVNFYDDSGTLKVRKADASDATKPAHGYVTEAVNMGANATVYTDGYLPGTGLTIGSSYFLSEDSGDITTTPPTTSGAVWQKIGRAVSATQIKYDPEEPVIRA